MRIFSSKHQTIASYDVNISCTMMISNILIRVKGKGCSNGRTCVKTHKLRIDTEIEI